MKWMLGLATGLVAPGLALAAADWGDRVASALAFADADGAVRAQVSGLASLTAYRGPQENPGLVFTEQDVLLSPRLALFLDGQLGPRVNGFVQARVDRGFDPGDGNAEFRLDEYALRFALGREASGQLEVGKFATVLGNWVARHDEWQNPFVSAPLPYEYLTGVTDESAQTSPADLLPPVGEEVYEHLPIIWGPSYATGVSLSGRQGKFDFAVEFKNTGPSSRPAAWPLDAVGFAHPSVGARLGFRPDLRFKFGLSASDSVFLLPDAAATLPPGGRLASYRERLWGQDFAFEWHHLQVWAELFEVQFDLPQVGPARTVAGYVEMRYKVNPRLAAALRWNRQVFSNLAAAGGATPWGTDLERIDLAATFRCTAQSQFKAQVSAVVASARKDRPDATYALQFVLRL
jgi:hypothetical protein